MKILLLCLFLASSLFSLEIKDDASINAQEQALVELEKEDKKREKIVSLLSDIDVVEEQIFVKNSVWLKSYASYLTSLDVRERLQKIKKRIKYLNKRKRKTLSQKDELNSLVSKEKILASEIEKLKKKDTAPFLNLITPPNIEEIQSISNPFDIFTGISLTKTLDKDFNDYLLRKDELTDIVALLKSELKIYKQLELVEKKDKYVKTAKQKEKQLERFETALDTMSVTADVYKQRLEIIQTNLDKDINTQIVKIGKIGVIILVVFVVFFLLKLVVKKYITDHDRFYMANKIITFTNFIIIIMILFFNYIENAGNMLTILGFASAGIAIAMKDWFMSILGWLVIVIGGSVHVGDRIR